MSEEEYVIEYERPIITQDWSLERIAIEDTPPGWEKLFLENLEELRVNDKVLAAKESEYGVEIKLRDPITNKLTLHNSYLPLRKDVFSAYHLIRPENVKVVIFGQDPYPQIKGDGVPRATGLSFSVTPDDSIPMSLRNIFKMIEESFPNGKSQFPVGPGEEPRPIAPFKNGDLRPWCSQGVMLLNASLTICPSEGKTHYGLWSSFIGATIKTILEHNPKLIAVLFGREAQQLLDVLQRVTVIQLPRPAAWDNKNRKEFMESRVAAEINRKLILSGQSPIDWNLPDTQGCPEDFEVS